MLNLNWTIISSSHEWANLGQGAPEVGDIPEAPPRPVHLDLPLDVCISSIYSIQPHIRQITDSLIGIF